LKGAKFGEQGGCECGCGAIRKKLSLQNALATFIGHDLALSACTTKLLSSLSLSLSFSLHSIPFHSTPSNDLGENISDIAGGREHLSFWLGINNLQSMGFQTNVSINFEL
jgi:hypothetical protein